MARPKQNKALLKGWADLLESFIEINRKLDAVIRNQKKNRSGRGPGRPPGSKNVKPGRIAGRPKLRRGPGRPPGSKNKRRSKAGRPRKTRN